MPLAAALAAGWGLQLPLPVAGAALEKGGRTTGRGCTPGPLLLGCLPPLAAAAVPLPPAAGPATCPLAGPSALMAGMVLRLWVALLPLLLAALRLGGFPGWVVAAVQQVGVEAVQPGEPHAPLPAARVLAPGALARRRWAEGLEAALAPEWAVVRWQPLRPAAAVAEAVAVAPAGALATVLAAALPRLPAAKPALAAAAEDWAQQLPLPLALEPAGRAAPARSPVQVAGCQQGQQGQHRQPCRHRWLLWHLQVQAGSAPGHPPAAGPHRLPAGQPGRCWRCPPPPTLQEAQARDRGSSVPVLSLVHAQSQGAGQGWGEGGQGRGGRGPAGQPMGWACRQEAVTTPPLQAEAEAAGCPPAAAMTHHPHADLPQSWSHRRSARWPSAGCHCLRRPGCRVGQSSTCQGQ